jgi:hypothetical protein
MILPLHIIIALSSVFYSVYAFFSPSKNKLYAIYALTALTIISGTYLVITHPGPLAAVCTTGLVYIGIMLVGIWAVHHKLAGQKN